MFGKGAASSIKRIPITHFTTNGVHHFLFLKSRLVHDLDGHTAASFGVDRILDP